MANSDGNHSLEGAILRLAEKLEQYIAEQRGINQRLQARLEKQDETNKYLKDAILSISETLTYLKYIASKHDTDITAIKGKLGT